MKNIFLLTILFALTSNLVVKAQVTVGAQEASVSGALLQLKTISDAISDGEKNATKGFAFPRVALVVKNQLWPMYPVGTVVSDADKKAHKGLVVFNVTEDDKENLVKGINVWTGSDWVAVSETQSKAEITFDCTKVSVYGNYYRHAPLSSNNYIIIPITVTKKGDYTIIASTSNGYYFQASGVVIAPGDYEIRLEAMGTPAEAGNNKVSFTNNGAPIEPVCNNVFINVGIATLTYRINNCENIKVFGDYWTRRESDLSHYAEIPIEVITPGTTIWETNFVNGVKFVANQVLNAPGETILTIKAQGLPKQSGKYTYNIITDGAIKNYCSFDVTFSSSLGTYNDPACKCLDIYAERPDAKNGEYFLQDCIEPTAAEPVVKTFCDLTGGGYTLVWSVSERTANSVADFGTGMVMGSGFRFSQDKPRNRVTAENGNINYNDYRLNNREFQHFPNSVDNPTLKVRICEDPIDMNDEWGLNNYGIMSPRTKSENPVYGDYGPRLVPSTGKVFGKRWEERVTGGGGYGGWDEVTGNRHIAAYSNTLYPTHWDWGGSIGSTTLFEVVPHRGGTANTNNRARMYDFNNTFGWFGETGPNHHWGKCGGNTASDYNFSTLYCAGSSLVPHTNINRYLQWFIK